MIVQDGFTPGAVGNKLHSLAKTIRCIKDTPLIETRAKNLGYFDQPK